MTTLESHINIKNIDKSDWKVYKFSEIAKSISERVEPNETELETYVGLEHLDSESIHIKRFGKRDDVTGTKLRCYPGDIIFGRRRAYQRKAAIVEFDGFCSAHALVLRANPNVIDPKLFPFFLHSDTFMHRAVDISVGSLSPTINWGALKNEEFLLPPKDQQARLVELLWAADEMIETQRKNRIDLLNLKQAQLRYTFDKSRCRLVKISQISVSLDNRRIPIVQSQRKAGEVPYYGASGIVDYVEGFIFDEPILLISEDGENLESRKLPIAYLVDDKCWVNNHAHVLKIIEGSRYLVSEYFNNHDIGDYISGGTRPKLTKGSLMDMPIYLPKENLADEVEKSLIGIDRAIGDNESMIINSKQLQKSLINQIF